MDNNNKSEEFLITFSPELEVAVNELLVNAENLGDVVEIPGANGQFSLVRMNTEKFKEYETNGALMFPVKGNDEFIVCTNVKL